MASHDVKRTILLVEDESFYVGIFTSAIFLADAPFLLVTVPDGDEAIRYIACCGQYGDRLVYPEPSLILLDLSLLRMDGFAVLVWMKEQVGLTVPPVIVFTGSRSEANIRRAAELGAREYVLKPANPDVLVDWIKGLNGKVSQWAAEPQPRR